MPIISVLQSLQDKHFELHKLVEYAEAHHASSEEIQHLKREKLALKDKITKLCKENNIALPNQ